jgi:DNA-binding Lrp family transcriptional regulator
MKLDDLDKSLLSALDLGPRIGMKPLAEQLDRSQQVLDYRLRTLQKRSFIQGFYPVIDSFRLGYRYCRLFVQLSDLSPARVKAIRVFASKRPAVLWCYRMEGDFNLVLVFWTKSLEEFERLTTEFLALAGTVALAYNQSQVYQLNHYPIAQVLLQQPHKPLCIEESGEAIEIDTLDREILRSLSVDARQPFSALAKRCKTSDKVAAYRISRLEDRGIIRGYRPLLAWDAAGCLYFKLFLRLDLSKPKIIEKVHTFVSTNPELLYTVRGVGAPGDVDLEVVVATYSDLFAYVDRLRARFPGAIRSLSHYHFTECFKVNYFPVR